MIYATGAVSEQEEQEIMKVLLRRGKAFKQLNKNYEKRRTK